MDCYGEIHYHDAEFFEGIPLTPDWLERGGWQYYNAMKTGEMTMDTPCKLDLDWIDGKMQIKGHYEPGETYRPLPIGSVHQLQNLYFCLTGTELIFNPFKR